MPSENDAIVLAVDIGTSSVKAGLYDGSASLLPDSMVSIPHEQTVGGDGTVEEPAEKIAEAVEDAISRVLDRGGDVTSRIAGVSMDSMASTLLGVDEEGRPVTPTYIYADSRPGPDVNRLRKELDESTVHQRTGALQHTSYAPGRIRWLQRTSPDLFKSVARWLDISTYLHTRWFGTPDVACSYSIASWSGLLNRKELEWDEDLLGHLEITTDALPTLAPYSDATVGLCPEFADRWPSLSDAPFFLAVGDGAAVNVGTGCTTPERIALTVGTSSAMRELTDEQDPEVPAGLWAYRLGREHTLLGGAFSEGGLLVEWANDVLKLPDLDQLDSELEKREPDSHGLTVLPFLAGERATGWTTGATGVFEGIRTSTTALDMVQAMMESVSLRFALVADLLVPERDQRDTMFVASGGAVRSSRWWARTMADAINSPVAVTVEDQATSRGAAILALKALGVIETFDDVRPEVSETHYPDPERVSALESAAERQQALYRRTLG